MYLFIIPIELWPNTKRKAKNYSIIYKVYLKFIQVYGRFIIILQIYCKFFKNTGSNQFQFKVKVPQFEQLKNQTNLDISREFSLSQNFLP